MERLIKLTFVLFGTELLPKEISEKTGISATLELRRGEKSAVRDIPKENLWALDSQLESDEVADLWEELRPLLDGARDTIQEIAKSGTAKFTIGVESQHRLPSIIIPASMAEFAGFVGAVIDIDHLQ